MKAKSETRGRMVAGAADLIRRRGANATSVREVVRYTQSPRGSITHHFPGGKKQLVEEAVRYAGREVSDALRQQVAQLGLLAGLGAFLKMWRGVLQSTQFEAGCPVLTVSVEQYAGDDNAPDPVVQERLLDLTHEIFTEWQQILSSAMQGEGLPPARARRLARLVVSSIEGTVALCRASRSIDPLTDVQVELTDVLGSALGASSGNQKERKHR